MKKILKSTGFLTIPILLFLIIFIANPSLYMQSCLNGLTIWFYNVLPALFPFFIATRLLIMLDMKSLPALDKILYKSFKTKNSGKIFFLSLLSGYPIGAKLICDAHKRGELDLISAKKMLAYCSVSGPMFIIGSVGLAVFKSLKIGFILLISHILSAIINGFVFRFSYKNESGDNQFLHHENTKKSSNILGDSMLDSITSILLVGGYIVLAFVFIDLLVDLKFVDAMTSLLCKIPMLKNFNTQICSIIKGCVEMTRGIIDLNLTNLSLRLKVVLASFMIGFGGICVFLQSLTFTSELKIKKPFYLFQKICQGIWACLISLILSVIFL